VKPTARAHVGWLAASRGSADVKLHRKHVNMADLFAIRMRGQDTAKALEIHDIAL
jgi:hypothetical protein